MTSKNEIYAENLYFERKKIKMVLIHRDTFDMIRTDLPRIIQSNDYFAVDELIAPPIQILNRKGYITEWCCAGHPFNFISEGYMSDDPERKIFETRNEYSDNTYISFKEGIFLPMLPPGFEVDEFVQKTWNKLVIRKNYGNNDVYVFIRNILETMEQLREWALRLPNFERE